MVGRVTVRSTDPLCIHVRMRVSSDRVLGCGFYLSRRMTTPVLFTSTTSSGTPPKTHWRSCSSRCSYDDDYYYCAHSQLWS